jgi:hypothetical protein
MERAILEHSPEVEKAEVLYNHGTLVHPEFTIEITFRDGRKMLLLRVNYKQEGDIRLKRIGDYGFFIYGHTRDDHITRGPTLEMAIIARETGKQLDCVKDIIVHYNVIYDYVDGLENIDAEKYAEIDITSEWVWDPIWKFKIIEYKGDKNIIFREQWRPHEKYWYD